MKKQVEILVFSLLFSIPFAFCCAEENKVNLQGPQVFNEWEKAHPPSLQIEIETGNPGNIFISGDEIVITVNILNTSKTTHKPKATFKVTDYFNQVVKQGEKNLSLEEGGNEKWVINLGKELKGYFTVDIILQENDKIISGKSIYLGVLFPVEIKDVDNWPFGVDTTCMIRADKFKETAGDMGKEFTLYNKLGIGWMRIMMYNVSPQYNEIVKFAQKYNVRILGSISGDCNAINTDPDFPGNYAQAVKQCVKKYKDYIRYWEIWNEPDLKGFFNGTPEQYFEMLKSGYEVIKSQGKNLKVLIGALCALGHQNYRSIYGTESPFDEKLLALNAQKYWDILNFHSYPADKLYRESVPIRQKVLDKAGCDTSFWLTETGGGRLFYWYEVDWSDGKEVCWTHNDIPLEDAKQKQIKDYQFTARHVVRSYCYFSSIKMTKYFWFLFRSIWKELYDPKGYWTGLVRPDYSPFPVFVAYNTLIYQLGNAKYHSSRNLSDSQAYNFTKDNQYITVAWNNKQQDTLKITNPANIMSVVDAMGNNIKDKIKNNLLEVGNDAVFIQCKDNFVAFDK